MPNLIFLKNSDKIYNNKSKSRQKLNIYIKFIKHKFKDYINIKII
jgi:hypothetical protein